MSYEKKNKTNFLKNHSIIIINNGSKNDNAAAAISYRSEFFTSRIPIRIPEIQKEEKRMEIYLLLKKNLKYSCTCIVHEKAYGEEYIQSE